MRAFANASLYVDVDYRIGRITPIKFGNISSSYGWKRPLKLLGFETFSGIQGDVARGEMVFPKIQYFSDTQVNISCSAFDNCSSNFNPNSRLTFYFAFSPETRGEELLQSSLLEFSQKRLSISAILLYTSIEASVRELTGISVGRVSAALASFAQEVAQTHEVASKDIRRIKKKIEKTIVDRRAQVAHPSGAELRSEDMLPCFETALEFYWKLPQWLKLKQL